ncbi:MAG: hypothetical protein WCM76_04240 [Bacteroidota bacterium]
MKYLKPLSLIVVVLLFAAFSCKTAQKANTPESVAKRFLEHFSKLEFDKAAELGTADTRRMIEFMGSLADMAKEKGADSSFKGKAINVEIVRTVVDGKVAVVYYKDQTGKEQRINLLKQDGKWLVDMKKEDPMMKGKS